MFVVTHFTFFFGIFIFIGYMAFHFGKLTIQKCFVDNIFIIRMFKVCCFFRSFYNYRFTWVLIGWGFYLAPYLLQRRWYKFHFSIIYHNFYMPLFIRFGRVKSVFCTRQLFCQYTECPLYLVSLRKTQRISYTLIVVFYLFFQSRNN